MNTLLKRKVLTITVLTILSIGAYSISSGLATPLLHKGEQAQVLSKLSIGTPSANSLLTVKSNDNDARLKLLPDSGSDKSLLIQTNSLSLGNIRVGDSLGQLGVEVDTGGDPDEYADIFGAGTNEDNWEESLQYPTEKDALGKITAVAPKQSINVHGKIVMEGLKAPNTAAETDQLCVAPNGTLTRCSTSSGYKWVATGFSACLDDQSVINNTISSLANYQNPQCTSVIIDTGVTATASSGSVGFNTFESALDKLKSQKAHAAIVSQGIDIGNGEVLCNPATPASVYSGYSGKKVQSFVCKSLNSCEIVADSFCADSVGAKPVYEASCVVPATDTGGGCQDGCYLNADNLCVQTADTVDTGSGGSCIAQNFPWTAPSSGASCAGNFLDGNWVADYAYCSNITTQSQCNAVGLPGANDQDCCIWSE